MTLETQMNETQENYLLNQRVSNYQSKARQFSSFIVNKESNWKSPRLNRESIMNNTNLNKNR